MVKLIVCRGLIALVYQLGGCLLNGIAQCLYLHVHLCIYEVVHLVDFLEVIKSIFQTD